jgi:hypothetical protein
MYVNDLMKSAKEISEAIGLVSQLHQLLERGGFCLTKWYSNSTERKTIPETERAKSKIALGIKWNTEDKFVWDVSGKMWQLVNKASVTRRTTVSAVYLLFDPLGFNLTLRNERELTDLSKLQAICVDRCFKPVGFGIVKEIQLHLFSDASQLG